MNDTTTDVTAYSSSVELPVSPDEAFALVTEPDRLRRWSSVCATVELRAGGAWSWHVTPSHTAGGTIREVDPAAASCSAGGGRTTPRCRPTARR